MTRMQSDPQPHPHQDEHGHPHDHDHAVNDHSHDHGPEHDQPHNHGHPSNKILGWLAAFFHLHGHDHSNGALARDRAFLDNELGIRTVWLALAALLITALLQILIVVWSGSVALFADTIHNLGDGLNSIPLLIAFYLARRAADRRYTYGYGRAEDVAGILIVLSIAFSAGVIFWGSIQKFLHPEPMTNLRWVAAAAVIGFLGNEAVALLQIRVGRKIDSAAMVADGYHARTDGLTSLAVLIAVAGTWLGFPIVDPIIGILIGIAILFITRDATRTIWYRLMDAIDPAYPERAGALIRRHAGVKELRRVRMRWMGHRLHADICFGVDAALSTEASHHIAEHVRHELFHQFPELEEVVVHVDPLAASSEDPHHLTKHHEPVPERAL